MIQKSSSCTLDFCLINLLHALSFDTAYGAVRLTTILSKSIGGLVWVVSNGVGTFALGVFKRFLCKWYTHDHLGSSALNSRSVARSRNYLDNNNPPIKPHLNRNEPIFGLGDFQKGPIAAAMGRALTLAYTDS